MSGAQQTVIVIMERVEGMSEHEGGGVQTEPDSSLPLDRVLPQHGLLQVPQHAAPIHLRHPHPLGKQAAQAKEKRKRGWGPASQSPRLPLSTPREGS